MAAVTPAPTSVFPSTGNRPSRLLPILVLGICFGIVLVKSEAVSWFRIQEMFRFDAIHMYGILGSAVVVAGVSVRLIRWLGVTGPDGQPLRIEPKERERTRARLMGGFMFGCGWALLGACPGPIYALIGTGVTVLVVSLAGALAGAWLYGHLRPRLPH